MAHKIRQEPLTVVQDFLGRDIRVGDYLASGGAGNRAAEYGMILYKVLKSGEKLQVVRLSVSYPKGSIEIKSRKSVVQNPNKYVLVDPPEKVRDLFERALEDSVDPKSQDAKTLGKWLHGTENPRRIFQ